MKNCKCNGWKLLATAIIKQGFCDYDQAFIKGDWIQSLYELSGHNECDFEDLNEYGKISSKINLLNAKIRYKQKIGADYKKIEDEKKILLEKRKKIRKLNKKVLTNKK